MTKLIIGLTGGIGSGKSAACQLFEESGIDIVDADLIAREVVAKGQPALEEISTYFGSHVLQDDCELNRAVLRKIVFSTPNAKAWLDNLLHPIIREQMIVQAQSAHSAYVILAIPLLVENNLSDLVDRILVIDCPESLQIERASKRDKNSTDLIKSIIKTQATREQRKAVADDIVDNSRDLAYLSQQIDSFHRKYLSLI
ncbi:dephospho-CoA kinase [Catenovulum sp. SM1970]|uniref:dephospho-CoA kinase n=1 Tax=Marinifaba aquimaris TaxID=2741323 RepID=UPI0015742F19|nr:dephospho-CoA kinase [Marinifaba aquimaris]NTS76574.1 dephospho-CoA kinase [Marinifaba aquimaris]